MGIIADSVGSPSPSKYINMQSWKPNYGSPTSSASLPEGFNLGSSSTNDASKGMWGGMSFGEKANTILGGLQTIAGIYTAFQQISLAKKHFALEQDKWNKTWNANKKAFNEGVKTRADLKYHMASQQATKKEYMKKHSL